MCIENPEVVKKWGDTLDWHHAVGTGPFILKDFVADNHANLVRNPNYWGHDERYPQNKLPYIDKLRLMIIPDQKTTLAEMRAGRIDVADQISPVLAQEMRKTNPEILQIAIPQTAGTIDPRHDKPPFNDVRVRKAMQMAIDLPGLAKTYYKGTVEPYPSTITARALKGWGFPYEEWPQDLKDEYAYNPKMAKKLLADAGYPDGFKTNIVANTSPTCNCCKSSNLILPILELTWKSDRWNPRTWSILCSPTANMTNWPITQCHHTDMAMSQSGSLIVFTRDIHPTT